MSSRTTFSAVLLLVVGLAPGCGSLPSVLRKFSVDLKNYEVGPLSTAAAFRPYRLNELGNLVETPIHCPYPYLWTDQVSPAPKGKKRDQAVFEFALGSDDPSTLKGVAGCFSLGSSDPEAVSFDTSLAIRLFEKAAELGDLEAMCQLGSYGPSSKHLEGSSSLDWLRKSAEAGHPPAEFSLGAMYHRGQGVEESLKEAVSWYRRAADHGHAAAQYRLGILHERGEGVDPSDELARRWMKRSASLGDSLAMSRLGDYCYSGRGGDKSVKEARAWWQKAAEAAPRERWKAAYNLAVLYWYGDGVPQSAEQAAHWARLSSGDYSKCRELYRKALAEARR